MPGLRARELSLRSQLDSLAAQLTDRDAYLKLADDLEGFLARLRRNASTATPTEQQRVLRLIVKDVLIGPERIVIRHSIPAGGSITAPAPTAADSDDDEEPAQSSPLRWRSRITRPFQHLPGPVRQIHRTDPAACPQPGRTAHALPAVHAAVAARMETGTTSCTMLDSMRTVAQRSGGNDSGLKSPGAPRCCIGI